MKKNQPYIANPTHARILMEADTSRRALGVDDAARRSQEVSRAPVGHRDAETIQSLAMSAMPGVDPERSALDTALRVAVVTVIAAGHIALVAQS